LRPKAGDVQCTRLIFWPFAKLSIVSVKAQLAYWFHTVASSSARTFSVTFWLGQNADNRTDAANSPRPRLQPMAKPNSRKNKHSEKCSLRRLSTVSNPDQYNYEIRGFLKPTASATPMPASVRETKTPKLSIYTAQVILPKSFSCQGRHSSNRNHPSLCW